ncbi:MAG: thioredoxin family protein [Phaeodactylibacter sp.]|nr:thioredoxin family protein [Phaeodactylibacter sp.]MCB9273913.1 thioredoxin family protein [Lewinellaceae bacterium]
MKFSMLFIALALAFSAVACNDTPTASSQANTETAAKAVSQPAYGISIGDKAPDFELKNVDGKVYSLSTIMDANGQKPKGYIIVFTCNTCPYAQANEQRIMSLHEKYATMGYPVVAIQPNDPAIQPGDSFAAMQKRAEEKGYPFLYLFDEAQEVFPQYGATRTPEVFLLDSGLTLRYHGAIDDSARDPEGVREKFVEKAIEALEKGEAPSPATTKALGCGIKAA